MEGSGCVPGFHTPCSSRSPQNMLLPKGMCLQAGPRAQHLGDVSPWGRLGLQGAECFCCSPVSSSEPDPAGLSSGKGRAKAATGNHREDPAGSLAGSPDQAVQRASRTGPSVAIAPTPPACSFPTAMSPQNPTSSHPPGLTIGQPGTLGLRGSRSKLHCST